MKTLILEKASIYQIINHLQRRMWRKAGQAYLDNEPVILRTFAVGLVTYLLVH